MDDGREKNGEGRRSREMWERSDCREESVVLYTEMYAFRLMSGSVNELA